MRENTDTEMQFQHEIIEVFKKYDKTLGFAIMGDVMIAWLINEMRYRGMTFFAFLKVMTKTWKDLTTLRKKGLV